MSEVLAILQKKTTVKLTYLLKDNALQSGVTFAKQTSTGYSSSVSGVAVTAVARSNSATNQDSSITALLSTVITASGQIVIMDGNLTKTRGLKGASDCEHKWVLYNTSSGEITYITSPYIMPTSGSYKLGIYLHATMYMCDQVGSDTYTYTLNNVALI